VNSIGHVVVTCKRCDGPRRVEVLAEVSPIELPGSWSLRMVNGGQDHGTCWIKMRAGRVEHDCPKPPPRYRVRRVS
jgi:hypothetical protein